MTLLTFPLLLESINDLPGSPLSMSGDVYDTDNLGRRSDLEHDKSETTDCINTCSPHCEVEDCEPFDSEMCGFCCIPDGGDENEHGPDFSSIEDNNGYGLFDIPKMIEFIYRATLHSSKCGVPLNMKTIDKK
jgi:hypothetical protein